LIRLGRYGMLQRRRQVQRRVSPAWRRPKPRVRTAAASARPDPTRTTSFVALVIAA